MEDVKESIGNRILDMQGLKDESDYGVYTIDVTFPPRHNKAYGFLARKGQFAPGDFVRAEEYENKIVCVIAVDTKSPRAFKFLIGKKV